MSPLPAARVALLLVIGALVAVEINLGRARRLQLEDRGRRTEAEAELMNARAELWNSQAERQRLAARVELAELDVPDEPAPEP